MITTNNKKSILASAIVAALSQVAPRAEAVVNASTSPSSHSTPIGQTSSKLLVWTVSDTCASGTSTVTSTSGTFRTVCAGGTVLGTVNTSLSNTKAGGGTVVHTIPENLVISSDIAFKAQKLGLDTFFYQRTFTSPSVGPYNSGCLTVTATSPAAAGFSIGRLALTFDNDASVRVLERKQPLRANAEVNFNGSGLMQAQWEVANPATTSGEPIFRTLSTVRQHLVGGDAQTIASPPLPTDIAGLYLIRLRVTDPAPGFDIPVIRYFVTDPQTPARTPTLPLELITPPSQALLAPNTAFVWTPITGARSYQLEVYQKPRTAGDTLPNLGGVDTTPVVLPSTGPITGMLLAGAQTRAVLPDNARARLLSGENYLWRILAVGRDGDIIAESPVREVKMP